MNKQLDWLDDLSEERQALPQDDKIQMLSNLAEHYVEMERDLVNAEALLKVVTERFRKLREELIPDRMQEFGIKKIVLDDGSMLSYAEFYAGKVIDDGAYDWLEANGYQDAVKQELKLEVSRTDHVSLERIKEFIAKNPRIGEDMSIKEKQFIHHMTLGSAIKGLTKQGKELPKHLIETFIGTRATLKKGKNDE